MIDDTAAFCGLFCGSCGIYIATIRNDGKELERIAQMMKTGIEEIPCRGCRSDVLSPHCRMCGFKSCAKTRNLNNCEECGEFPCDALRDFQKQLPHRTELFESAQYRNEHGIDQWLEKMREDYSCEKCGEINSPYYTACRKCGNDPANPFIRRNISSFRK